MAPIRSSFYSKTSDSLEANQTSNGTYPVRPHHEHEIKLDDELARDLNGKIALLAKDEV